MSMPGFQDFMRPFLEELQDGETRLMGDMNEILAGRLGLSELDKSELLPSGTQKLYINRIGWTRTYLKNAGLVESPGRAQVRITPLGQEVLTTHQGPVNIKFLSRFPSFVEFHKAKAGSSSASVPEEMPAPGGSKTPEEILFEAYESLRVSLSEEMLSKVRSCSPEFFERLVVELIVKMGYGGSMADAGRAVGRSGDGGIDGIIKEDKLGLDVIYLQAKRWTETVGRPEIQKFSGALDGQRAKKGIFITTSTFSKEAKEFAGIIDKKIILIDGVELASHMIDFNVGVAKVVAFELKKLDLDFFEEA